MDTTTPQKSAAVAPTGCCPPFDPDTWDDREVMWRKHLFVKEHVRSVLHVPIGLGTAVTRAMQKIDAAHAAPPQPLMLADDESPWGTDLYIDVTKPVPGAEMVELSGTFLTHVYDGPFREEAKWAKDMRDRVESDGHQLKKLYFAYTTCPNCAKAYGHNYVVAFAKIAEPRRN